MSDTAELLSPLSDDVQARRPTTEVSLTRVGVRGVEKVIAVDGGPPEDGRNPAGDHYFAEIECFVDLDPRQAGVHMSRFEEVVNEAIDSVVLGETLRAEELAAHIAGAVLERQNGMRAEVTIAARYPETVPAPVSKVPTQEIYTLLGTAVASARGTRTLTGVEAQGMTACPASSRTACGRWSAAWPSAIPSSGSAASSSPARRTSRRSTATRSSPSARGCSPRSSPSSTPGFARPIT